MPGDPTATTPPEGYARIGVLGRPYQLEGALRLSLGPDVDVAALDNLERVFVPGYGPAAVRASKRHGSGVLLYLQGVRDRDAARRLTGAEVYAELRPTPRDPSHDGPDPAALDGQEVRLGTRVVGRVRELRGSAANPLLVVDTPAGETLLPLQAPYVTLEAGWVALVDPPEGLLEPS